MNTTKKAARTAIVHDFLTQLGGAERVLDELHTLFPNSPVYTLLYDEAATHGRYRGWDIRTSFLQHLPKSFSYKWFLPLMPFAVAGFDLADYSLILSDASAFAKGARGSNGAVHICYCHTPTRYLWQQRDEYVSTLPYSRIIKAGIRPLLSILRKWDFRAAQKVDEFIANSEEVRQRIKRYYQRESYVVHPPVNTAFFTLGTNPTRDFFLTAGRLEPYKRFDLAIDACNKLGLPLVVAGVGTNQEFLQKRAGPNIRFLGRVSDEELRDLYRNARAFIFPAFEDAGIMVLESLACGTPVIAYGQGGATEFIRPGLDGLLFPQQSGNSLASALEEFELLNFDPQRLAERASQFSCENFQIKIRAIIDSITESRLSFNPNERLV